MTTANNRVTITSVSDSISVISGNENGPLNSVEGTTMTSPANSNSIINSDNDVVIASPGDTLIASSPVDEYMVMAPSELYQGLWSAPAGLVIVASPGTNIGVVSDSNGGNTSHEQDRLRHTNVITYRRSTSSDN